MAPGVDAVGRPKKGSKKPAKPTDVRKAVIHLKGTDEYIAWFDEVHVASRYPKATIVRWALADWAEKHGYRKPPEL